MSETEKLTQTISEFETEVAGLTADIADLEQQLVTATTTAETAIATAERRADKASQAAAVDAEQACQRLATALGRKRLALTAAGADLAAARHGLEQAKRGALYIQLQAALDELTVRAAAVDDDPTDLAAWADLRTAMVATQARFRAAGGKGTLTDDPLQLYKHKLAAITTQIDWVMREPGRPLPVAVPRMVDLLRLDRARGLARELMTLN